MTNHYRLDSIKVIEFLQQKLPVHANEEFFLIRDFNGVLTVVASQDILPDDVFMELKREFAPWVGSRLLPDDISDLISQIKEESERVDKGQRTYFWAERLPHLGAWLKPKKSVSRDVTTSVTLAFYSYKGGVGRSTLAAATAFALSRENRRVLLIDADFEAPDIPSYFYPASKFPEYNPAKGAKGLVEYLNLVHTSKVTRQSAEPSIKPFIFGNDQYHPNLAFISAGDLSDPICYANEVARINFNDHSKAALVQLLEKLRSEYEFILFDSRTGLTDAGGLITNILADFAIFVGYPDDQTLGGLRFFAKNLVPHRDEDNLKLQAMWIHSPAQKRDGVVDPAEHERFRSAVADSLKGADILDDQEISAILGAEDIPAVVAIPFQDDLRSAVRLEGISILQNYRLVWAAIQQVVERVKVLIVPAPPIKNAESGTVFSKILAELKEANAVQPINPAADEMKRKDFVADFLPLESYRTALDNRRFLILGRKGMGKTTLERLLSLFPAELDKDDFVGKILGTHHPSGTARHWCSVVSVGNYHTFARFNAVMNAWDEFTFERFWALVIESSLRQQKTPSEEELETCLKEAEKSGQHLEIMSRLTLAFAGSSELVLTFDGLDEAFPGQRIRSPAIDTLIQLFWRARNRDDHKVSAKIFYRTDLFDNEFSHPNKGHMKINGAVSLDWKFEELLAAMLKSLFSRSATLVEEVQKHLGHVIRKSDAFGYIPDARESQWLTDATRWVFGDRITQPYAEGFLKRYLRDGNDRYFPRFALRFLKSLIDHAKPGTNSVFDTYQAIKKVYWDITSDHLNMELLEMYKDLRPICEAIQARPAEAKQKLKSRQEFQEWLVQRLGRSSGEELLKSMAEAGLIEPYDPERNAPIKLPDMYRVPLGISLTNGLPPKPIGA